MTTKLPATKTTFISAAEAAELDSAESDQPSSALVPRELWEVRLAEMAKSKAQSFRVPRNENIKKAQVVDSILDAFELLGGTSRLTLWANENYGEFMKIYAKLAPRQIEKEVSHDGGVTIKHILPRGRLDT